MKDALFSPDKVMYRSVDFKSQAVRFTRIYMPYLSFQIGHFVRDYARNYSMCESLCVPRDSILKGYRLIRSQAGDYS
jgi:hypothetical protein